jgi:site-specific DNA recombinase
LVRMTNEDLARKCEHENDSLELIKTQLEEVDSRLAKLYDALETGEFKGGELAPRIKALFDKKEDLNRAKAEAEEALKNHTLELASPEAVQEYVRDLRSLLEAPSFMRQKAFLRSFVERIEVDDENAKVIYTMPMPPDSLPAGTGGVLPIVNDGPL